MPLEDENQFTPLAAKAKKRSYERLTGKTSKTSKSGSYKEWLEKTRQEAQKSRAEREKAQQEAFKNRIEAERKRYQDMIKEQQGKTPNKEDYYVTREYRDTYNPDQGESYNAPGSIKTKSGSRLARNEGLYEVSREVSGGWRPATPEEQAQLSSEGGGLPGTYTRTFGEGAPTEIWEDRITKVKFERTLDYQKALTDYQNKLASLQQELSAKEGVWAAEMQKKTKEAQDKITKMKTDLQNNKLGSAKSEAVKAQVSETLGQVANVIDAVSSKENSTTNNPYQKTKTKVQGKTVLG